MIEEIISDVDQKKNKKIGWWNSLPKKEQFKAEDIVFNTFLIKGKKFIKPTEDVG